jgi:hypothetical protein
MGRLPIATADELMARDAPGRQAERRAARQTALVRQIYAIFVVRGGPIPVDDIAAGPEALSALDDDDLIRVRDGHVDIAYPFSAAPTPFVVRLPSGQERYACCAVDALGIAPMLDQALDIRSRCHHCGEPLELSVTPEGPGPGTEGVMLWFGPRGDERCKVADAY